MLDFFSFEEPQLPIGKINKSHEELPSVVSQVVSIPVVVTRAYITKLGLLEPT